MKRAKERERKKKKRVGEDGRLDNRTTATRTKTNRNAANGAKWRRNGRQIEKRQDAKSNTQIKREKDQDQDEEEEKEEEEEEEEEEDGSMGEEETKMGNISTRSTIDGPETHSGHCVGHRRGLFFLASPKKKFSVYSHASPMEFDYIVWPRFIWQALSRFFLSFT